MKVLRFQILIRHRKMAAQINKKISTRDIYKLKKILKTRRGINGGEVAGRLACK